MDLVFCSTLPQSVMDLAEPPVRNDWRVSHDQPGRLESPPQRTAINLIEHSAGHVVLQSCRLPTPSSIHRGVELTLKPLLDIPIGLPMPYQNQSSFRFDHRLK